MIGKQRGYLQALSDLCAWHQWQIGQKFDDMRARESHEQAAAYLDVLIATKKHHAAEDEADHQRPRAANSRIGGPRSWVASVLKPKVCSNTI